MAPSNRDSLQLRVSEAIVISHVQPYLQRGHNLFIDSWHARSAFFEYLHENLTSGTVRKNKGGIPIFN